MGEKKKRSSWSQACVRFIHKGNHGSSEPAHVYYQSNLNGAELMSELKAQLSPTTVRAAKWPGLQLCA